MAKRSNDFQVLIALINHQLAASGSRVTESKMLPSSIDGRMREVDVVIELPDGPYRLIGIECRDHGRKPSVEWVEQIITKHRTLGIDKSIAVASRPFTSGARAVADAYEVQLLSLEAAKAVDWLRLVNRVGDVQLNILLVPSPSEIGIQVQFVDMGAARAAFAEKNLAGLTLHHPTAVPTTVTVLELADDFLASDFYRVEVQRAILGTSTYFTTATFPDQPIFAVDDSGQHHLLHSLRIRCVYRRQFVLAPAERVSYGGAEVAVARAEVHGKRFTVTFVEREDGQQGIGYAIHDGSDRRDPTVHDHHMHDPGGQEVEFRALTPERRPRRLPTRQATLFEPEEPAR